jgi:hypothetical protein
MVQNRNQSPVLLDTVKKFHKGRAVDSFTSWATVSFIRTTTSFSRGTLDSGVNKNGFIRENKIRDLTAYSISM